MWSSVFEATLRRHLPYFKPEDALEEEVLLIEYGLDSIAAINLLLDLEDTFGIVFPEDSLTSETFSTASDLWAATRQVQEGVPAHDS